MKYFMKIMLSATLAITLAAKRSSAQSVLNNMGNQENYLRPPELVNESIRRISASRRIFIISNVNHLFGAGDYISLLADKKLVARALVAKTAENQAGIKILKIYSVSHWKNLGDNVQVQVLKGDDSYYTAVRPVKKTDEYSLEDVKKGNDQKIVTEVDLYNDTTLISEEVSIDDYKSRVIKTDNIVGASYGLINAQDVDGGAQYYAHFTADWMYQLADNIWGEAIYGVSILSDYPAMGVDTKLSNMTGRLKYCFSAPFYSYIQPYVGFQVRRADRPVTETAAEDKLVGDLEKQTVIFGATILKRLVPGWFAKLDLGSDLMKLGLAIEF